MSEYWLCSTEFICNGSAVVLSTRIVPSWDDCTSQAFGMTRGVLHGMSLDPTVSLNISVDWRENDNDTLYFDFDASVAIGVSTGEIKSNSLVLVSTDYGAVAAETAYISHDSMQGRTDIFHVYDKPGVYRPAYRFDAHGDTGVLSMYSCSCPNETVNSSTKCSSGDSYQNSSCVSTNPVYMGTDGLCHTNEFASLSPTSSGTHSINLVANCAQAEMLLFWTAVVLYAVLLCWVVV